MKIKSLSTSGFGKFNTSEEWQDFSPGLNVFYGKNEAGKTTIFKMILFLLYGASDKKKQYLHLKNEENQRLNVSGLVQSRDRVFDIHRNLLNDENSFVGPVPGVGHVPRKTYEDIYALNLEGLTKMNVNTWSEIQDLLLSQYSSDTFRTPKAVLEQMNKEMRVIKKPSERGNSVLKDLEEKRHQAYIKKKHIQGQLHEAENLEEKIKKYEGEIDSLKTKKSAFLHQKDLLKKYMPIFNLLEEEGHLRKKLKVFKDVENFNLLSYEQNKSRLKALYIKMDETSEKVSKFVLEKRRLLSLLEQDNLSEMAFSEMFQRHVLFGEWALDLKEKDRECQGLKEEFIKAYEHTFEDKFQEEFMDKILSLNDLNLKSLIQEIEEINEEIKAIKRQKRIEGNERSNTIMTLMILLLLAGGAAFYFYPRPWVQYLSLFVMGLSVMQLLLQLTKRRMKHKSSEALIDEKELLKNRLKVELNGLRLSSIVEEFIGQEFLSQILALKNLAERYSRSNEAYVSKKNHYEEEKYLVDEFLKNHLGSYDDIDNPFDQLAKSIENIKSYKNRVEVINGQTDVLNEQLKELENELNTLETWVFKADDALKSIGDGDLVSGLEVLKVQESLLNQLKLLGQKLEKTNYNQEAFQRFKDDFLKSDQKDFFDLNHLEVELSVLDETLNEKIIFLASMKKDWLTLTTSNDYHEILGKIEGLDQEILANKEQYDRYQIMTHLVKSSDDIFRLKNQPQVFKKAGEYLSLMTQGKYYNLQVIEEDSEKSKFTIKVDTDTGVKNVDIRFSKGTLNQVYLALRLSLMDHLDKDAENLPICFDELLVEWDQERLNETIKILETLSAKRQVIIFTCHTWFVEAIKKEDVKVFEL